MSMTLVLRPRLSEKSYALSQKQTYVFEVPITANKLTVAKAVTAQFQVTVTGVRINVTKGKAKRTVRKGGRAILGRRSDSKRAYVTLKEGDSLPIFAAIEEAEKKEKRASEAIKEKK